MPAKTIDEIELLSADARAQLRKDLHSATASAKRLRYEFTDQIAKTLISNFPSVEGVIPRWEATEANAEGTVQLTLTLTVRL